MAGMDYERIQWEGEEQVEMRRVEYNAHPVKPSAADSQNPISGLGPVSTPGNYRPWFLRIRSSQLWALEIVAAIFGIVCTAVVAIVCHYENGKSLAAWRLRVSPNALVSFITTLAKSSFCFVLASVIGQLRWIHFARAPQPLSDLTVFDDASRGPLGAFQLLLRSSRVSLWTSYASLLMIVALLVDPFTQLLLDFPTQQTLSNAHVASIFVAPNYFVGTPIQDFHGPLVSQAQNAPFNLQSAVVSAIFSNATSFEFDCPTSNCTYPPFVSLGVCSHCEDVTATSKFACGSSNQTNGPLCTINTPQQLIQPTNFTWTFGSDATGPYGTLWNSTPELVVSNPVSPFLNVGGLAAIGAFTTMNLTNLTDALSFTTVPPIELNQCLFVLCAKSYPEVVIQAGKVNTGTIGETLLQISSNATTMGSDEEGFLIFDMSPAGDNGTVPPDFNFTMAMNDYYNIGMFMADVFNSSVGYLGGGNMLGPGGQLFPNSGVAFYSSLNISGVVQQVADSMTNSMRTSQLNLTTIIGTALVNETFIRIEWRWFALPIVIAVLAPVLLLIVMQRSYYHGVEVWKASSMPLLFYRLEGWDESTQNFGDANEMFERSELMQAQMLRDRTHRAFLRTS